MTALDRAIRAMEALVDDCTPSGGTDEDCYPSNPRAPSCRAYQKARRALADLRKMREGSQRVWASPYEVFDPDDPYTMVYRSPTHPHLQDDVKLGYAPVPALLVPLTDEDET